MADNTLYVKSTISLNPALRADFCVVEFQAMVAKHEMLVPYDFLLRHSDDCVYLPCFLIEHKDKFSLVEFGMETLRGAKRVFISNDLLFFLDDDDTFSGLPKLVGSRADVPAQSATTIPRNAQKVHDNSTTFTITPDGITFKFGNESTINVNLNQKQLIDLSCAIRPRFYDQLQSTTEKCMWCKEVTETTVSELWSMANPTGYLTRLCKSCGESCAGG